MGKDVIGFLLDSVILIDHFNGVTASHRIPPAELDLGIDFRHHAG
jgi:hypothetical protein